MTWYHILIDVLDNVLLRSYVNIFWKGMNALIVLAVIAISKELYPTSIGVTTSLRIVTSFWLILWIYPDVRRMITYLTELSRGPK